MAILAIHPKEIIAFFVGIAINSAKVKFFHTLDNISVLVVRTIPAIDRTMVMLTFYRYRLLTLPIIADNPQKSSKKLHNYGKIFLFILLLDFS